MSAYSSTSPLVPEARLPGGVCVGGRFLLKEEIGHGGTSIVYRALDRANKNVEVAVKVVRARVSGVLAEPRLRNEARLGQCLVGFPYIASPIELGRLGGPAGFEMRMFLATQYVRGASLDVVIRRARTGLTVAAATEIAHDVARALVGLHEQGIVHRDIKPGNIMVAKEAVPRARLIDFGLAYSTGGGGVSRSPDLTLDGIAPGTLLYMPLEQALHLEPEPAFDVYALGVVLFEMLVGSAPHHRVSDDELLRRKRHAIKKTCPIAKLCPELPEPLVQLVERCLELDGSRRPTAQELVSSLSKMGFGPDTKVIAVARPAALPSVGAKTQESGVPCGEFHPAESAASTPVGTQTDSVLPILDVVAYTRVDVPVTATRVAKTEPSPVAENGIVRRGVAAVFVALAIVLAVSAWRLSGETEVQAVPAVSLAHADEDQGDESAVVTSDVASEGSTSGAVGASDPALRLDAGAKEAEPIAPRPDPPRRRRRLAARPAPFKPTPSKEVSCDRRRAIASTAKGKGRWSVVLKQTKYASCWPARVDLLQLRVQALLRLGMYRACVLEADGSGDAQVLVMSRECSLKIFEGAKDLK